MTATLNTIQTTDRHIQIRWTAMVRRPADDGFVLTGDVIGQRGRPVAGICAAVLYDSGSWSSIRHIGLGFNRIIG